MNDTAEGAGRWWDSGLLARWIVVNAAAYVVIVVGGVALELLASNTTKVLASEHRAVAVVLVAVIGAAFHGLVLGRWQWRILVTRMPGLPRRQWVIATLVPALVVWLLAIAPGAIDTLAQGGDTLAAFKNGFIQAIVLGPLIGLSQATTLRDHTARWMWWFAANITTYLLGSAAYEFGKLALDALSISKEITPAFPLLGFLIYGVWMLWVTAPEAAVMASLPRAPQGRHRTADPGTPD